MSDLNFLGRKMVPGKGNISKGKGATNVKGSTSATKVKRERVSEPEDSDEEVTLADVRAVDYGKVLPRFTSSNNTFFFSVGFIIYKDLNIINCL